ncbi:anaerobic sulfite reductase subunit AsrA [Tepidibacter formicigenes]|jgi:anaerobic sulfite reductase subunit A|uniref:Anaerobic sulfite reductase subunit A n=1 Tax=Tepidibacter formicigenes DSM 15518 TaxID=1123349 RepID=A0A1M6LD74_9FIRM|nr:anaerobic sulfite reductase subunit AsrA [Tepidibacter formicigenes]SHJ69144.1 anaerobic sulfite reductase subunit A [Tepidibacter formicigenes DSM 15518]
MGFQIQNKDFNKILESLKKEYKIYAPKRFEKRGRFSDTDLIKYGEINSIEEIVYDEKSHYSPKEIVYPITQTLFYFTEEEYKESTVHDKKIIIFLRPCDINGMRRLDTIFLQNGPFKDVYYERLREKVKFVMMECRESFENCFCVSMNSNYTDNYSIGVRFEEDRVICDIKDSDFKNLFEELGEKVDFTLEYVKENNVKVNLPNSDDITVEFFNDKMWEEYSKRCIACGRCNTSCITCSCFTTQDISYEENPNSGERRRVWAGCHIDKFTNMAGGHDFRKDYGSRMRFKTMHKIYDYNKRFGEHMCVGCGRCDDRCPQYISFSKCINKVSETLKKEETTNE